MVKKEKLHGETRVKLTLVMADLHFLGVRSGN